MFINSRLAGVLCNIDKQVYIIKDRRTMKPVDFINNYELHDSILREVDYDRKIAIVDMEIELCNYEQTGYKETDPETSIIHVRFFDVAEYNSEGLAGKLDTPSILEHEFHDQKYIMKIMDDDCAYHEISFITSQALVKWVD